MTTMGSGSERWYAWEGVLHVPHLTSNCFTVASCVVRFSIRFRANFGKVLCRILGSIGWWWREATASLSCSVNRNFCCFSCAFRAFSIDSFGGTSNFPIIFFVAVGFRSWWSASRRPISARAWRLVFWFILRNAQTFPCPVGATVVSNVLSTNPFLVGLNTFFRGTNLELLR